MGLLLFPFLMKAREKNSLVKKPTTFTDRLGYSPSLDIN